jgi:hypothetical protein
MASLAFCSGLLDASIIIPKIIKKAKNAKTQNYHLV